MATDRVPFVFFGADGSAHEVDLRGDVATTGLLILNATDGLTPFSQRRIVERFFEAVYNLED